LRVRTALSPGPMVLVALVALAAVLRTRTITQSLWYDEILTVRVAQAELTSLYTNILTYNTTHLPLYCILARLFLWLMGNDWSSRVPALLFSIAQVPVFWLLAKRVVDRRVAWVATFLLVISPIDVHYAQDARSYTLLGFGSLLALYGLWIGLHDGGKRAWFLCFLGSALSLHAAYFGAFAVLAQGILVLLLTAGKMLQPHRSWRDLSKPVLYFAACGIGAAVAFLPCIPLPLALLKMDVAGASGAAQQIASFDAKFLRAQTVMLGWGGGAALWLCYAALTVGLLYALYSRRSLAQLAASYTIAAYLPFFLLLWYNHRADTFQIRYIIFLLPAFLLLVAQGLTILASAATQLAARIPRLRWTRREAVVACVACAVAVWCFWPAILGMSVVTNENWRDTCRFVEAHAQPDDATVVQPTYAEYGTAYYGKSLPHVTPLKSDDVEGLSRLAAEHARIWYIAKWGGKTPKMAKAMAELGFVPIYDAWAQGLILEVRDLSFKKEERPAAEVYWRTMACREVAWTPFMDVWLGRAFRDARDETQAAQCFRKACDALRRGLRTEPWTGRLEPKSDTDRLALARVLSEMGDKDGARIEYHTILGRAPADSTALLELAKIEDDAQNCNEAIRLYDLYMRSDPAASPYVLFTMAELYERIGDIDTAFDLLKTLDLRLKESEGAPPYYRTIGACALASHGQVDRALLEFRAVLTEKPDYTYAYWRYAEVLMKSGRNSEARDVVNTGLTYDSKDQNLLDLKQRLENAAQSGAAPVRSS